MRYKLNELNAGQVLGRSEMKKIMAGSGDNCGICADWAVCCICLDGTNHGCQTSSFCSSLCSF